jgi:hypothetical protein
MIIQGLDQQIAYHESERESEFAIKQKIARSHQMAAVLGKDEVQLVRTNAFFDPQLSDGISAGRLWSCFNSMILNDNDGDSLVELSSVRVISSVRTSRFHEMAIL